MMATGKRTHRRRRVPELALALFVQAALLAGCSSGTTATAALEPGTVIDHYTLGAALDCASSADAICDRYLRVATESATSERGVAPASIVGHHFYAEAIPGYEDHSAVGIVVLDIADGSRVAVGVYCGVGPCQVVKR